MIAFDLFSNAETMDAMEHDIDSMQPYDDLCIHSKA